MVGRVLVPSGRLRVLLLLLVIPSIAVSLVGRSVLARAEWDRRDYAAFDEQLKTLIPRRATAVVGYNAYYTGIAQGWQMYNVRGFENIEKRFDSLYLLTYNGRELPDWTADWDCTFLGTADVRGWRFSEKSAVGYSASVYRCVRREPSAELTDGPRTDLDSVAN